MKIVQKLSKIAEEDSKNSEELSIDSEHNSDHGHDHDHDFLDGNVKRKD